jgi:hypothetical protein
MQPPSSRDIDIRRKPSGFGLEGIVEMKPNFGSVAEQIGVI